MKGPFCLSSVRARQLNFAPMQPTNETDTDVVSRSSHVDLEEGELVHDASSLAASEIVSSGSVVVHDDVANISKDVQELWRSLSPKILKMDICCCSKWEFYCHITAAVQNGTGQLVVCGHADMITQLGAWESTKKSIQLMVNLDRRPPISHTPVQNW